MTGEDTWRQEIYATDDPARFRELWLQRFPWWEFKDDLTVDDMMGAMNSWLKP